MTKPHLYPIIFRINGNRKRGSINLTQSLQQEREKKTFRQALLCPWELSISSNNNTPDIAWNETVYCCVQRVFEFET